MTDTPTTASEPTASADGGDALELDLEGLRNVARHIQRAIDAAEAAIALRPGDRRSRLIDRARHSAAQAGREIFNVLETEW